MLLNAITHSLELVTSSSTPVDYYVEFVDYTPSTSFSPSTNQGSVASATTTSILAAPASGVSRKVKHLSIRNTSSTASINVTLQKDVSGTNIALTPVVTLQAGECLFMNSNGEFSVMDTTGRIKTSLQLLSYISGVAIPFRKVGTAAEAIGVGYSFHKDSGFPGAWSPGAPGLNGRNTNGTTAADAGCLPLPPISGTTNWLSKVEGVATVAGSFRLFDIVWVNTGLVVTTTTAQAITTPTFPARDIDGSTNGRGYNVGILVTAATTNAGAITNTTISYTNSDGVAGRTGTIASFPATAVVGTFVPFQLQAGDTGIRSIQSVTLGTSYVTGSISLIVYTTLEGVACPLANIPSVNLIPSPGIRLYQGSCLIPINIMPSATTALTIEGLINVVTRS
jgi:hypothetical protein